MSATSPAVLDACKKDHPDWGVTLCDVSKPDQVEKLFADVKKILGGLDVLVNNAGIGGPTGGVDKIKVEEWMQTIDINLNGQFLCAHHAVPLLRENAKESSIICISSVAGRLGYALRTPYAATNPRPSSVSMKVAGAGTGARGHTLQRHPTRYRRRPAHQLTSSRTAPRQMKVSYEDMEQQYLNKISLRRMVSPQDVANMALYLCSPLGAQRHRPADQRLVATSGHFKRY